MCFETVIIYDPVRREYNDLLLSDLDTLVSNSQSCIATKSERKRQLADVIHKDRRGSICQQTTVRVDCDVTKIAVEINPRVHYV